MEYHVGFLTFCEWPTVVFSVQDSESDEGGVPNYLVVATDYDNFAVVYNCKSGYIYNSGTKKETENYS